MASIEDFRIDDDFARAKVNRSGRIVGRTIYWKLYSIENLLRVLIDSTLSVAYPEPRWWMFVLSRKQLGEIESRRQEHKILPWSSTRGNHALYYLNLSELGGIILATEPYMSSVIEDTDALIRGIATIRQPRNVVAHMSFPSEDDKSHIDDLHSQVVSLIKTVEKKSKIILKTPK